MRILFVNPTVLMRRPIAELAEHLVKDGHTVGILTPRKLFKRIHTGRIGKVKGVKYYSYPTLNLWFMPGEWPIPIPFTLCWQVFKAMRHYDIMHVWTYAYFTTIIPMMLRRFIFWGKRTILTADTIPGYSIAFGKGFIDWLMRFKTKMFSWFLFWLPNKITLYGRGLMKYARKAGMPRKKISIIPTGVHIHNFSGRHKDMRKQFGIKKDEALVLFVGLLLPRKGVDTLIKVAERLKRHKVKFKLLGEGPHRKRYEEQVKRKGLSDKIIFAGHRKNVYDFYRSADIFFLPSRGEGLPGVVMEAMASGLPVVSSDIPLTYDIIKNGKTGLLCPPEDVEGFAKNIERLIKNKKLRKTLGDEAKKEIEKWSWENVYERYEKVYNG